MKHKRFIGMAAFLLLLTITGLAAAAGQSDLAAVRAATARFHRTEAAQTAGWDLLPGLDHCFENPGVGAMSYHYINAGLLDLQLKATKPEALVYAPDPQGRLKLAAVEYIVPAAAWDDANPGALPMVLGRHLHLNEPLGVYVLHAWIFRHNPDGMFEDWNPNVSCP